MYGVTRISKMLNLNRPNIPQMAGKAIHGDMYEDRVPQDDPSLIYMSSRP